MTLLLVEDDRLLAETLVDTLRLGGHQVDHLADGEAARTRLGAMNHGYALVLLDLNLPGCSGLDVLTALRRQDSGTPVLILTARGAVEDRVCGLDLGADDYLAKPFALDELEARVRALMRRRGSDRELKVGSLVLDVMAQRFTLEGEPLGVPPREQRLLTCLMRHAGEPVEKVRLAEEAFQDQPMGDNAIEVYIHRLRKRLTGHGVTLRTVRGLGYVLETT
ncbi:response regulator [Halomonas korlensis]|uniref:Two-component system, OmpR family, response regulator TctD n=1 Tax=Halomonas korlensis TaxID=463301 RepID=A0A1I7F8Z4_9GAMM|nr:response regulator transcription factor [Halomonas korlensis]SFU32599.1 two-component system, OmpR family, response regulator TctD [Halomonas korlensis]